MLSFRSLASPGERTTEGVEHLQQAHEKVRADGKMIEVSKVRITEAGRGALTAEGRCDIAPLSGRGLSHADPPADNSVRG